MGGKFHSSNLKKKLNAKFQKDQKALYTQYYNDVYTLKDQNAQLVKALEQRGVTVRWKPKSQWGVVETLVTKTEWTTRRLVEQRN